MHPEVTTTETVPPTNPAAAGRIEHLAQEVEQLRAAVQSRDVIGQAKGMLMERYQIDAGHAFQLLARVSQATHRKLHVVAAELVATGELDQGQLPHPW